MTLEQQVKQFNKTYNVPTADIPTVPDEPEATRMVNLITEELMELNEAIDNRDIIEFADAVADILYVTAQQAVVLGLPVDALLREVHRSNMSKLDNEGNPILREDGKVLKGDNFTPPDISGILDEHYDNLMHVRGDE